MSERVVIRTTRDVNGKDSIDQKIVTRTSRTSDREEVVIDIYLPALQADRLALSRRIHRVTTVTEEGTQTVEDCSERSLGENEPLRVVERSVTTVRKTGPDSYVSERQQLQRDANGRFVPFMTVPFMTDPATAAGR